MPKPVCRDIGFCRYLGVKGGGGHQNLKGMTFGLSYRHLSEAARRLFERLSRFPGGIWCEEPGAWLPWDTLLGVGNVH